MLPPRGAFEDWRWLGAGFHQILTAAVIDMTEYGYDSAERVAFWIERLREAAQREAMSPRRLDEHVRAMLQAVYASKIERGGILVFHPGVQRFTLADLKPKLHAELGRRIAASAELIKLHRDEMIDKTMRRFSGWATSVPLGGSGADQRSVRSEVGGSFKSLPFLERRVAIDQGHKMVASLSEIIANDGGAIGAMWHSNWRQQNYDARLIHEKRDRRVYLVRDSWADRMGLVQPGSNGYTDDMDKPGEFVFCRCWYTYLYSLNRIPRDMLTPKGVAELERVRLAMQG